MTAAGGAPATASDGVAAALARLAELEELEGLPTAEHVDLFDAVHRLLQDALATIDEA